MFASRIINNAKLLTNKRSSRGLSYRIRILNRTRGSNSRPSDELSHFESRLASSSYVQGQSPQPRIREYFYYVDHQGMLFLDDSRIKNFTSCFKDKKFLAFFFQRLRINSTDRYKDHFPYISFCGRERNYVRCDDLPVVYTHVIQKRESVDSLSYAHADDLLTVPFLPEKIFMSTKTGRVYHPAPDIVGGIGLVRSKLAVEFAKRFRFLNGEDRSPTHFTWDGDEYELDTVWYRNGVAATREIL